MAVFTPGGDLLASAYGKPPWWAEGIHAAELWALLMSISISDWQNHFRTGCMAILKGVQRSQEWANAAARRFGRAWGPVSASFEGDASKVAWMPAHCAGSQVGLKMLSNGFPLSDVDLKANR